jgi:HEAT repeat protein
VEYLIQALKDGHWRVRREVAKALDKLGWTPGDEEERVWMLIAKGEWNKVIEFGEKAVEPIVKAIKDGDWGIREKAVAKEALKKIKKRLYMK